MRIHLLLIVLACGLVFGCKRDRDGDSFFTTARGSQNKSVEDAATEAQTGSLVTPDEEAVLDDAEMGQTAPEPEEVAWGNSGKEVVKDTNEGGSTSFSPSGSNRTYAEVPVVSGGEFKGTARMDVPFVSSGRSNGGFATGMRSRWGYVRFEGGTLEADRIGAARGDPGAQFRMGVRFLEGDEVEEDPEEAFKWFLKAAEQDIPEAQYNVGLAYLDGWGAEVDHEKSVDWFFRSAEQGLDSAQHSLALRYFHGEGVEVNYEEAAYWYSLAAEQGHSFAQNNLGCMYLDGLGVPLDYGLAEKWLGMSASMGNPKAQFNLGNLYADPDTFLHNNQMAAGWFSIAAREGHAASQVNLSYAYETGTGLKRNLVQAYMWAYISHQLEPGRASVLRSLDRLAGSLTQAEIQQALAGAEEWLINHPKP